MFDEEDCKVAALAVPDAQQGRKGVNAEAAQSDIQALLARADDYVRKGDARAAVSFYQAALNSARSTLVPDARVAADLKRAQAFIEDRGREFQDALNRAVDRVEPEHSAA